MAYINTETNQYPVSEADIRAANPNTSFSSPFQAPEPYAVVFIAPVPTVDNPILQFAREIAPVLTSKGHYEQAFEVVDKFADYTDADGNVVTKAEQEAAAIAADEAAKKVAVKAHAEQLLKDTDYLEGPSVSDSTKSVYLANLAEIVDYRVALRAIAVNPPVVVTEWPVKPDNVWATNE